MDKTKMKKVETFASIFGEDHNEVPSEKTDGTTSLKLDELIPFRNHPFKLYEGERFNDMVESIKNYGVIVPIVVRQIDDKFEILSGHNRVNAAKEAGLTEIPTVIKEGLTEEEATLIVTETNLMQRSFSELAYSERATVIATRHTAMKNQGVRNDLLDEIEKLSKAPDLSADLTFRPLGEKLRSDQNIGEEYGISPRNISRYLRINELNAPLKDLVDEGKIAMRAGVDLSYLSQENQEMVEAIISENTFKVDMKKATLLRKHEKEGNLNWNTAQKIISGDMLKSTGKVKPFKLQPTIISKYFNPNEDKKAIEETIEKALDFYFSQMKNQSHDLEEGEEMIE